MDTEGVSPPTKQNRIETPPNTKWTSLQPASALQAVKSAEQELGSLRPVNSWQRAGQSTVAGSQGLGVRAVARALGLVAWSGLGRTYAGAWMWSEVCCSHLVGLSRGRRTLSGSRTRAWVWCRGRRGRARAVLRPSARVLRFAPSSTCVQPGRASQGACDVGVAVFAVDRQSAWAVAKSQSVQVVSSQPVT